MIAVELRGRLGNQMFQYAFALAAAEWLGTDFTLYLPSGGAPEGEQLSDFFTLGGRELPIIEDPGLPRCWVDNRDYERPEDVFPTLRDNTSYGGYFQAHRFFEAVESRVRAHFQVQPDIDAAFRQRYGELVAERYVCCQVRRADYETFLGGSQLPLAYYRDALAMIRTISNTPVVFIGDDLDEASRALGDIGGARFEPNTPTFDFQLILHAHSAIISNSTFAWWGAWLNKRAEVVIAPRYWLGWHHHTGWQQSVDMSGGAARRRRGWEFPPGIIPDRWVQVPVRRPWRERLAPWSVKTTLALAANNLRAIRPRKW
jgi:hypothetical protein